MRNKLPFAPWNLIDWGQVFLSPQQLRVWRHLTCGNERSIEVLFNATRKSAGCQPGVVSMRRKQQIVGSVVARINTKLEVYHNMIIKPGERRGTYRLIVAPE